MSASIFCGVGMLGRQLRGVVSLILVIGELVKAVGRVGRKYSGFDMEDDDDRGSTLPETDDGGFLDKAKLLMVGLILEFPWRC